MKKETLIKYVKKHVPWIIIATQTADWKIGFFFDDLPNGERASATIDVIYKQVNIIMDFNKIKTEKEAMQVLLHEFLHLLHADFYSVFDFLKTLIPKKQHNLINHSAFHGAERNVLKIKNMLMNGLKLDIKKIRKLSSKKSDIIIDVIIDEED